MEYQRTVRIAYGEYAKLLEDEKLLLGEAKTIIGVRRYNSGYKLEQMDWCIASPDIVVMDIARANKELSDMASSLQSRIFFLECEIRALKEKKIGFWDKVKSIFKSDE